MCRLPNDLEKSSHGRRLMGGFGSGRRRLRRSLEGLSVLHVRQIRRFCECAPGFTGYLSLADQSHVELRTIESAVLMNGAKVLIEFSATRFGGRRAWFRCPKCERRCAAVYDIDREPVCRNCTGASYASQREGHVDRLLRRSRALRRRLGDTSVSNLVELINVAGRPPFKPSRMHWRTYERLASELIDLELKTLEQFCAETPAFIARLRR
jgi:hypothetical protein